MADKTNLDRWEEMDRTNIMCARIIAAKPDLYAGLMLMWATKVLARLDKPHAAI